MKNMKVLIFAGGLGTRLGEETCIRPKPMIEIGRYPIIWHIMKIYSHYGFNDFIVLTGYKQEYIKNYFLNYHNINSDLTIDLSNNSITVHSNKSEHWKVTLLYTGYGTNTAGRLNRAKEYVKNETFMLTYGDGVADIDINQLIECHRQSNKVCTLTSYQPEGRYGVLQMEDDGTITRFTEKPKHGAGWINAGFMVCEPEIFNYMPEDPDNQQFEPSVLKELSSKKLLNAYKHNGFWHSMDTLKDKNDLNKMWDEGEAKWKIWENE